MNKLRRRIQQWRELESWERRLVVRLLFLLLMTWVGLRALGFNRARRIAEFELPPASTQPSPAAMEHAHRSAQLTSIAARHGLYKANCLHQALALCWILRKQNLPSHIRIGVLPQTTPFQAHAWVELDGVPLGQSVDEYKAFERLAADPETTTFV